VADRPSWLLSEMDEEERFYCGFRETTASELRSLVRYIRALECPAEPEEPAIIETGRRLLAHNYGHAPCQFVPSEWQALVASWDAIKRRLRAAEVEAEPEEPAIIRTLLMGLPGEFAGDGLYARRQDALELVEAWKAMKRRLRAAEAELADDSHGYRG
jgi:hypothetical protein